MYQEIKKFTYTGILFAIVAGAMLHFVYNLTGKNAIAAIFSPVNESVWEHLKLIFYPMSIYLFLGYFKHGKKYSNYTTGAVLSTAGAIFSVVVLFYTYTGIIGSDYFIIDIIIFVLSVSIGFLYFYFIIKNYALTFISPRLGIVIMEFVLLLFALLTIFPPEIPLFIPPEI